MDDDLKSLLGQYFQQFGQQIQQVQQTLGGQIQQLREDTERQFREALEETDRQFREMREEMGARMERIETEVRGAYVLIEDLPGQIRLVAEGVDNLRGQMERNDKELSRRVDEVMTFTRQAYRDLDARKLDKTA